MEMNLFLMLSIIFILTFILGRIIERLRVPWIFGGMLGGLIFAIYNPIPQYTNSQFLQVLSNIGMYFLLFLIGLKLDLKEMIKSRKFIVGSMFAIILTEAVFGTLVIHFAFNYSWLVSLLVATSFATVGEALLIPILDEFNLVNSKLGQLIIGIGTLDDVFELLTLIGAVIIIGSKFKSQVNVGMILFTLFALFVLTLLFVLFKKEKQKFKYFKIETVFLFVLFVFFLFLGVGTFGDLAPLAAVIAGISVKNFLPDLKLKEIEQEIKVVSYGFFIPVFFFEVGSDVNFSYLIKAPLLILLVVVVSDLAKLFSSYVVGHNYLGWRKSIIMGIALSVRFSTSIVIIKLLYDSGVVGSDLYSVIIAASIIFKFIIPALLTYFIVKWGLVKKNGKRIIKKRS